MLRCLATLRGLAYPMPWAVYPSALCDENLCGISPSFSHSFCSIPESGKRLLEQLFRVPDVLEFRPSQSMGRIVAPKDLHPAGCWGIGYHRCYVDTEYRNASCVLLCHWTRVPIIRQDLPSTMTRRIPFLPILVSCSKWITGHLSEHFQDWYLA